MNLSKLFRGGVVRNRKFKAFEVDFVRVQWEGIEIGPIKAVDLVNVSLQCPINTAVVVMLFIGLAAGFFV